MTGISIGEAVGEGFGLAFAGTFLAILSAPWARIYRDPAQPDVAATFA